MPGTFLFSIFALVHWCIALAALSIIPGLILPALCLFIVEAAKAFDNGATVLGKRFGLGAQAKALSRRRYLLHAVCIGFLVPVYSGIGGVLAFSPFGAVLADVLAWILVIGIVLYGYFIQYKPAVPLIPVNALGCLRYAQSVTDATRHPDYEYSDSELAAKPSLPMASIMATTAGLLFALVIVWLSGFWVPFIVTAIMFFAGALPQRGWGPVVISSMEVVFSGGMLYSLWHAAAIASAGL